MPSATEVKCAVYGCFNFALQNLRKTVLYRKKIPPLIVLYAK